MTQPAIRTSSLMLYGLIALPMAFAGFPLYVLAPDFYATHHGLSLTLLGELLLTIRLFDAVQDPVIGWLTDWLQGRVLPLVIFAALLLCLAITGLFNLVLLTPAIWFSVCMLAAVCAYSILTIVLGARAALWTDNQNDQTRIAGVRETFGLIGLVIAVSMPALLTHVTDPDHIYRWYSAFVALFMAAGLVAFARHLQQTRTHTRRDTTTALSLVAGLRALSHGQYRLFAIYALSMLASSIPAVLVIFYVRDLLHAEDLMGVFLLLYFACGAVGIPIWTRLSIRIGKYSSWALAQLVAVTGFIAAFFLGAGDVWAYGFVCVASGVALGADLTLPPSLLSDAIHAHDHNRFSGTHYAVLAFIAKASLALASAIGLMVLDRAGFKPQTDNTPHAIQMLATFYALIPCALKLMASCLIYILFIHPRTINPTKGEPHEITPHLDPDRSNPDA